MDKTIHSLKAAPIGKKPVRTLVLAFDTTVPDFETLHYARARYVAEGGDIEQALFDVLPGGVYDQLLAAMLTRKASLFRVAHGGKE